MSGPAEASGSHGDGLGRDPRFVDAVLDWQWT
jgi:hypothetical protein